MISRRKQKVDKALKNNAKADKSRDDSFLAATDDENSEEQESNRPSVDERQTFGNSLATWMIVEISPDGLQATLKRMSLGGDTTLTETDLLKSLREQYFITDGLNEKLIQELTARALANPDGVVTGNHEVARGKPATPGQDGRIEYTFQKRLPKGVYPDVTDLKNAFEQESIDAVLA